MKIPNARAHGVHRLVSLARIVSEDSQLFGLCSFGGGKSSKDS